MEQLTTYIQTTHQYLPVTSNAGFEYTAAVLAQKMIERAVAEGFTDAEVVQFAQVPDITARLTIDMWIQEWKKDRF